MGRLFWKTCGGTAPSLRCIGRLQRFVLIKNGRCWRKHLSMSVSRGQSSRDTSLFERHRAMGDGSRCVRLSKRCKRIDRLMVSPYQLFSASDEQSRFTLLPRDLRALSRALWCLVVLPCHCKGKQAD